MSVHRQFLGWNEPLTWKVADFLLPAQGEGPCDLSDTLVLVPTQQAGRRLREYLAVACDAEGRTLVPPILRNPMAWLRDSDDRKQASGSLELAVWSSLLREVPMERMSSLFPAEPERRDAGWALYQAGLLIRLRSQLAEGGYLVSDIPKRLGDDLPEPFRWRELAQLEEEMIRRLKALQVMDGCSALQVQAAAPSVPDGVSRLVVAGVPDLAPVVCKALEKLSVETQVDCLVHAPSDWADRFDEFGCSLSVDMPVCDDLDIQVAANPADQAHRVLRLLQDDKGEVGIDEVAVGVPDAEVIPELLSVLSDTPWEAFDPAGCPARTHRVVQLLQALHEYTSTQSIEALRGLLRHADLLHWLQEDHDVDADQVLAHWDEFQSQYLPIDAVEVMRRVESISEPTERQKRTMGAWLQVAPLLTGLCDCAADSVAGLRDFLQTVYQHRRLRRNRDVDEAFAKLAAEVNQALVEVEQCGAMLPAMKAQELLHILLLRLRGASYFVDRGDAVIDLEGWLEMQWSDAPRMIITGMNEGAVPIHSFGDPFLPDSLRERLGLARDATLFARDRYLLRALLASRASHGKVTMLCGKTSFSGDPLRPSRLLFDCSDAVLSQRLETLFGDMTTSEREVPPEVIFSLDPTPPSGVTATLDRLSVTAFKDYLECPFRFYLRRVLKMEEQSDAAVEMDAMVFGIVLHDVLEAMGLDEEIRCATREEVVVAFLEDHLASQANRMFGVRRALQIEMQLNAARQRLRWAAKTHVEQVQAGWEVVEVEHSFQVDVAGMTVSGKIDRIDRHVGRGAIRVLDYKSSDTAVAADAAHTSRWRDTCPDYHYAPIGKSGKRWTNLQLPLYHLLGPDEWLGGCEDVEIGYFNLPRAVQDTGLALWKGWSPALQDAARVCAEGVVRDIQARRFWPPRERVNFDAFESLLVGPLTTDRFAEWMGDDA